MDARSYFYVNGSSTGSRFCTNVQGIINVQGQRHAGKVLEPTSSRFERSPFPNTVSTEVTEQPYDSIPNFSAADALRITGVGRNEFIDIMNKCKSKKIMWKLNKSVAKELLPSQHAELAIEPWWGVQFVNFTLEEFKKLSEEETTAIDKICKEEVNSYVLFDPEVINGLYKRGGIYFDVPVYPDDRFRVSRLEGFVSNKDQSYEDPVEELTLINSRQLRHLLVGWVGL